MNGVIIPRLAVPLILMPSNCFSLRDGIRSNLASLLDLDPDENAAVASVIRQEAQELFAKYPPEKLTDRSLAPDKELFFIAIPEKERAEMLERATRAFQKYLSPQDSRFIASLAVEAVTRPGGPSASLFETSVNAKGRTVRWYSSTESGLLPGPIMNSTITDEPL